MDPEIQQALTEWFGSALHEYKGPSRRPSHSDFPQLSEQAIWEDKEPTAFVEVLTLLVPNVVDQVVEASRGIPCWHQVWPLLPDSVIGVLMQAGAKDYLPPVEG